MRRAVLVGLLWAAAAPRVRAAETAEAGGTGWRLSVGAIYRALRGISCDDASYAQQEPTQVDPGNSGIRAEVGAADSADADRAYDDGYVRLDDYSALDGLTVYWGYPSSDQVRDGALLFHAADGNYMALDRTSATRGGDADGAGAGVLCRAEKRLRHAQRVEFGLSLCLYRAACSASETTRAFTDEQAWSYSRQTVWDAYDLEGRTPPAAPYEAASDGSPDFFQINQAPTTRVLERDAVSSGAYAAYADVATSADVDLTCVSAGARVELALRAARLTCALGPAVTQVETEITRRESLFGGAPGQAPVLVNTWEDRASNREWKPGLFAELGAGLALTERLHLALLARYDWVGRSAMTVGPSVYTLQLDGPSVSATAGWTF
ncbi:MAG: hypothetical protein JXR37_02555 [Kiritimatiellae bacterium]|nr:hypothetical protein [Kiritimatiellia bacterium]